MTSLKKLLKESTFYTTIDEAGKYVFGGELPSNVKKSSNDLGNVYSKDPKVIGAIDSSGKAYVFDFTGIDKADKERVVDYIVNAVPIMSISSKFLTKIMLGDTAAANKETLMDTDVAMITGDEAVYLMASIDNQQGYHPKLVTAKQIKQQKDPNTQPGHFITKKQAAGIVALAAATVGLSHC